jgi:GntR family transcriptional repressor for pyruvate dehydrogenase complex
MPIQAIEVRRLYRQIADQIGDLIARGEFKPGERLPAERDLAKQLGVSRPSVREALIALEVQGYVEVRVGSGVYVKNANGAHVQVSPLPADTGPFELISARWIIEAECAALAAKNADAAQIQSIKQALDAMVTDLKQNKMPVQSDRLFHLRIAEATGNSALQLVVNTLWEERAGPLFSQLEHHFDTPGLWSAAIKEHSAIFAAIAAHDPRGARMAMRKHMDHAAARFSTSWSKPK